MRKVSGNMKNVMFNMDKLMESMDVQEISKVMDKVEEQFEDIDVHTQYMENSVSSAMAVSAPADDVSSLLRQVADAHHLKLNEGMTSTPSTTVLSAPSQQQETLDERLARLRSAN